MSPLVPSSRCCLTSSFAGVMVLSNSVCAAVLPLLLLPLGPSPLLEHMTCPRGELWRTQTYKPPRSTAPTRMKRAEFWCCLWYHRRHCSFSEAPLSCFFSGFVQSFACGRRPAGELAFEDLLPYSRLCRPPIPMFFSFFLGFHLSLILSFSYCSMHTLLPLSFSPAR